MPLLSPASPLVVETEEGPVLQEYPTDPPTHVLNGWINALWGLYDIANAGGKLADDARDAYQRGLEALAARLPLYNTGWNWSRYDLFPHAIVHVTSPFYHRLHVEQLRAMHDLDPRPMFAETADRWESGRGKPACADARCRTQGCLSGAESPEEGQLDPPETPSIRWSASPFVPQPCSRRARAAARKLSGTEPSAPCIVPEHGLP